uniref:General transcription factor IIE subunit 1 n=1 Tax=Strigamia maritima TaxID=126957 RepID=T1J924_STRMM
MDVEVVTEVPSCLKRLARMVVRGFYSMEYRLIIEMLVRHPCIKEDDLVDLLKFERKQLRTYIAQLKLDQFIKVRLKMETGPDGKATRQNYYFINYKIFVNIVKYKLDLMRRKIETEERDSTSRASFKCPQCQKLFTDLDVNMLFDAMTNEFRCTYCNSVVEEDESSLPKQDSRLFLAKYNDCFKPTFLLLHEAEFIRLAPEILEPEPTDMSHIIKREVKTHSAADGKGEKVTWSGDATRHRDFNFEQDVTISFGESSQAASSSQPKKERPIWMVESTVIDAAKPEASAWPKEEAVTATVPQTSEQDNIMQVLLVHEKKNAASGAFIPKASTNQVEIMDDDDDDEDTMITIGNLKVPLNAVTNELINKMTPAEKDNYIKLSQEAYANMYD